MFVGTKRVVTSGSMALVSLSGVMQAQTNGGTGCVPEFIVGKLGGLVRRSFVGRCLGRKRIKISFYRGALECLSIGIAIRNTRGVSSLSHECAFMSGRPLNTVSNIALNVILKGRFGKGVGCLIGSFLVRLRNLTPLYVPVGGVKGRTHNLPRTVSKTFRSSGRIVVFPTNVYSHQVGSNDVGSLT